MALTRINNQALPTISSSKMPAGSIVQTVQTTTSSVWYNSSAGTFQDVTGAGVSITPSSSSNKVLITYSAWGIINASGVIGMKLVRGSTDIHQMESLINEYL